MDNYNSHNSLFLLLRHDDDASTITTSSGDNDSRRHSTKATISNNTNDTEEEPSNTTTTVQQQEGKQQATSMTRGNNNHDIRRKIRSAIALLLAGIIVVILQLVLYHPSSSDTITLQGRFSQIFFNKNGEQQERIKEVIVHDTLHQQQQPSEKNKLHRRRLILHVGPSKTATTSLQTDLTKLQDEGLLEKYGYMYAGRYYRPYISSKTGLLKINRSETPLLTTAHGMLKHCQWQNDRSECCNNFVHQLYNYSCGGTPSTSSSCRHVILSEEPFGDRWRKPDHWIAIRDALAKYNNKDDIITWDVTIVVGYRRFYEWLSSARFQYERLDRSQKKRNSPWPPIGQPKHEFFPYWWDHWNIYFQFTTDILTAIQGTFDDVRIIDLHNKQHKPPFPIFLCDILKIPASPYCDDKPQEGTVMNKGQSSASLYYDAIATAAADRGLINTTKYSRSTVRESIGMYWEQDLQQTMYNLPMTCPETETLETLWNMSWSLEETYMLPLLLGGDGGAATSDDDRNHREQVHRAGFDEYVANKVFCWVNNSTVLDDPAWQEFLLPFSH